MKTFLKSLLRHTPYRIIRARDSNRFQAIEETLLALNRRGYRPQVVIDGGANVGDFARMARAVFGAESAIHLFEPQPACQPALNALATMPRMTLYAAAIGSQEGKLAFNVVPGEVSTGCRVAAESDTDVRVPVPVVTLDGALRGALHEQSRALLKLDLQGYELEALKGATTTLRSVEVALIEASFFAQDYEPPIAALVDFLARADFELHDVASITGRTRDNRARQADLLFVARGSELNRDNRWA